MTWSRILKFALWTGLGLALAIAALIGVALVLMTGQTGRDVVESFADGREAGRYGVIEIDDLSGDPLSDLSIGRLTLTDEDGVWLEIENARIVWRPSALLGRELAIESLSAERVHVRRRPRPAAASGEGGSGDGGFRVRVDAFDVTTLALDEPVVGVAAEYTARGDLVRADGAVSLDAVLDRLDQPGDRIIAEARFGEDIRVDAEIDAAADGALSAALGMAGHALQAEIDARGGVDAGEGRYDIRIDDAEALTGEVRWRDGAVTSQAQLQPQTIPQIASAAPWLDGGYDLALDAPVLAARRAANRFEGAALSLAGPDLSGDLDFADGRSGRARLRVSPDAADAISRGRVAVSRLSLDGDVSLGGAPWFSGQVEIEGLDAFQARADTLALELVASGPASAPRFEFDARAQALAHPALEGPAASAVGASPSLSGEAVFNREAGAIEIGALRAGLAAGPVTGGGRYALEDGRFEARASVRNMALSQVLADQPGELDLTLEASGAPAARIEFSADAEMRGVAEILGDAIRLSAGGRYEDGEVTLRAARARSDQFSLNGDGAYGPEGWRVQGAGGWSGRAPIAALELSGTLDAAFEARGAGADLGRARVELSAPGLAVGPVSIDDPRLRAELDEAGSGQWRFTGEGATGPVDVGGAVARTEDGARLDDIAGRIGGMTLQGAIEAGRPAVRVDLEARPQAGFGSASLSGEASPERLDLRLEAVDLVAGDAGALDRLDLALTGSPLSPRAVFEAEGVYNTAFMLAGEASADLDGEPRSAQIRVSGSHGGVGIATREPARFSFGANGVAGEASLALGEGGAQLDANGRSLTLTLDDAPARMISNLTGGAPLDGSVSGEAAFARGSDDLWTGDARLSLDALRPEEMEDADALALQADAVLSSTGWRFTAEAGAAGLDATAEMEIRTGPVTALGKAFPGDAALEGRLDGRGQVATLAAFRLPETLQLAGRLRAQAELSGILSAPEVSGRAILTSGRLRDLQTGLDLRVVDARAELRGDSLEITRVTSQDGSGGHFRGSGRADWSDGLNARFEGEFEAFRLINHPDRTATGGGSAAVVIEDGRMQIEGDITLDRAELRPAAAGRPAIPEIEVTEINAPGRNGANGGGGPGLSPMLDLSVQAPARVFVRGPQFDTEWGLDLEVTGRAQSPDIRGEASLLRGRASLIGQDFTLERGSVRFNGAPGEGELNLTATRETPDLSAEVRVTGRVEAPEIALRSTPSLPEDEIASRLLFNRGVGSLSGIEAAQLGAALASLSGGFDPFAAVRSATGLDQFAFASNAEGETVVSGGRYLTDDVYLELETPTAGGPPRTAIEWSLNRRLTLRSSFGADGDASVSLGWRREYD